MKNLIPVHSLVFVDGTKVGGISKIDYETNTVTCFDPKSYNQETRCFEKREVSGDISFFIEEPLSERRVPFDGTNIVAFGESSIPK